MVLSERNFDELVQGTIYGYFTKYDILDSLFRDKRFDGEIRIFIDLNDIACRLTKELANSELPISDVTLVASTILNMVGHYRCYFRARTRCDTKVWLINSIRNAVVDKVCDNSIGFKYPTPIYNTLPRHTIRFSYDVLNIVTPAIPNVQYVSSIVDFVTEAKHIMKAEGLGERCVNILISKDPCALVGIDVCTSVLRPKKYKAEDRSKLYRMGDAVAAYCSEVNRRVDSDVIRSISDAHLPLFMVLNGCSPRGLKSWYSATESARALNNIYTDISKETIWGFTKVLSHLQLRNPDKKFDNLLARFRFMACDTGAYQLAYYETTMPESKLYQGIVNMDSVADLKAINTEYFANCPVDLEKLMV